MQFKVCLIPVLLFSVFTAGAQDTLTNKKNSKYIFKSVYNTEATSVKDQCKTATCWSFSSLSFLESELLRKGKGNHDLSEMFIVRWGYIEKAITYIRMNGRHQFDQGGEFHDIPYIIRKYGIVPEEVYKGLNYGETRHNHDEMIAMLQGMLEKLKNNPQGAYTTAWTKAVEGVVDAYLGQIPEKFTYRGKEYTPKSFAESLGLNMDDYVAVTSFTHQPLYRPFAIEVPDNWSMQTAYNVSLDEMIGCMSTALEKGYSVAWAADVSEKGFSFRDGIAIVPTSDTLIKKKGEDSKYFNDAGAQKSSSAFDQPYPEKTITPELRQRAFDQQITTDDHGMHITGMVKDQNGTRYFVTKNSWGTVNYLQGYLYVSEPYARYKTISILVHKDALDKKMKEKLNID
ncbi:MAG: aminopeptidase [Bacteroidetes bacterium]|nr:aminopeptidase [Bacteroidota bacterium]